MSSPTWVDGHFAAWYRYLARQQAPGPRLSAFLARDIVQTLRGKVVEAKAAADAKVAAGYALNEAEHAPHLIGDCYLALLNGEPMLAIQAEWEVAMALANAVPPESPAVRDALSRRAGIYIDLPLPHDHGPWPCEGHAYLRAIFMWGRKYAAVRLHRDGDFDLHVFEEPSDEFETYVANLAQMVVIYQATTDAGTETTPTPLKRHMAARTIDKRLASLREFSLFSVVRLRARAEGLGRPRGAQSAFTVEYRVDVRGHFKLQPHGPGSTLRKLIWVDTYKRGPEDAPPKHALYSAT